MHYKSVHREGPSFSRIITGVWRWQELSTAETENLIRTSLDCGINTFDHADIYGDHTNEERFGKVLAADRSLRDKMLLITKCGIRFPSAHRPQNKSHIYDTSAKHIIWSAENSLRNLHTDRLDLLLIHRPDPLTDPEEVASAFSKLHQEGKVRHFGVSNFTAAQFRMLSKFLPFPIVTNQVELSVSCTEPFFNGDVDVLMEYGIAPMAWSPLAGGKPFREQVKLQALAKNRGMTTAQLSLAWLVTHPSSIFPVIGTTKAERIVESAAAAEMTLDRDDWFQVLQWSRGYDIP